MNSGEMAVHLALCTLFAHTRIKLCTLGQIWNGSIFETSTVHPGLDPRV